MSELTNSWEGRLILILLMMPIWFAVLATYLESRFSKDDFVGPFPKNLPIYESLFSRARRWRVFARSTAVSIAIFSITIGYCQLFERTYEMAGLTAYILFVVQTVGFYLATSYQKDSQFSKSTMALKWAYFAVALMFFIIPDFMESCHHRGCTYVQTASLGM
jgi:hypothetical protein